MRKQLAIALGGIAILVIVGFVMFMANQTALLVALADRVSPLLGSIVFWSLVTLYVFCIGVPAFMIATLPSPLRLPAATDGPEYERYIAKLQKRLGLNPHLAARPSSPAEVSEALTQLDGVADRRIREAASQVFVTTAISQNGSLDALLVLAAQSKLVLEVARIYYQRPTLRDLVTLYANVAGTAFIAAELEDIDLSEQVEPLLTAVVGSGVGAVPGFGAATTLFVSSVTTGTGNAFLTLRVGIITKQYCRALARPERRSVRRLAAVQALGMLGGIARDGAAHVAAAIWARPKKYFADLFESAGQRWSSMADVVRSRGTATWDQIAGVWRRPADDPGADG